MRRYASATLLSSPHTQTLWGDQTSCNRNNCRCRVMLVFIRGIVGFYAHREVQVWTVWFISNDGCGVRLKYEWRWWVSGGLHTVALGWCRRQGLTQVAHNGTGRGRINIVDGIGVCPQEEVFGHENWIGILVLAFMFDLNWNDTRKEKTKWIWNLFVSSFNWFK